MKYRHPNIKVTAISAVAITLFWYIVPVFFRFVTDVPQHVSVVFYGVYNASMLVLVGLLLWCLHSSWLKLKTAFVIRRNWEETPTIAKAWVVCAALNAAQLVLCFVGWLGFSPFLPDGVLDFLLDLRFYRYFSWAITTESSFLVNLGLLFWAHLMIAKRTPKRTSGTVR